MPIELWRENDLIVRITPRAPARRDYPSVQRNLEAGDQKAIMKSVLKIQPVPPTM
jgi:hypothetical protein